MSSTVLILLACAIVSVSALGANDWAKPCHDGECFYDITGSEGSMAATVRITGSPSAISDMTNAAGWEILDCSSNNFSQNVRLVCLGDGSKCSHLFRDGVEHTIVRLPEQCRTGPFARVSRAWISEDQSIPGRIRSRMKRSKQRPYVHALSLDTDFNQAAESDKGNVSIVVYASTTAKAIPRSIHARNAADPAAEDFDIFSPFSSSSSGLGSFIRNTTQNSIPLEVNQQFNVFNASVPCTGSTDAKISVDADINVQGEIDLGVVAQGTIVPPKFENFGLFASLSADLVGKLGISTDVSGEVESPEVPILNIGLPGLSIPDVISLGPSISLKAKATATLDVDLSLDVGIGYSISNMTVFFPPSQAHNSSAIVAPKDIPLELSVSPSIKSSTSFSAHLIPSLNLGLVAFGLSTAAFLEFDTSATLELDLDADANGTTSASTDVDGCVGVNGGIAVNVGLEADSPLFDLLGDSATITLAEKEFEFFKQCFPNASDASNTDILSSGNTRPIQATSTSIGHPASASAVANIGLPSNPFSIFNNTGFSCLPDSEKSLSTVVNKTLSSSSFKSN